MRNKEIEGYLNKLTSKADSTIHSNRMFYKIKETVKEIQLPKLDTTEIEDLKEHLIEFKKIDSEELIYKFLSLRNAFILLKEFEERTEHLKKVNEILMYLKNYEYIFELINEVLMGKNKTILDTGTIILDLEINRFCIKYGQLLSETDPTNYRNLNETIETKKIDYENIKGGKSG